MIRNIAIKYGRRAQHYQLYIIGLFDDKNDFKTYESKALLQLEHLKQPLCHLYPSATTSSDM